MLINLMSFYLTYFILRVELIEERKGEKTRGWNDNGTKFLFSSFKAYPTIHYHVKIKQFC